MSFPLATSLFARHNKKVWPQRRRAKAEPEVLVEYSSSNSLIGFSYLANALADEGDTGIRAFVAAPKNHLGLARPIVRFLARASFFFGLVPEASVYKSFGALRTPLVPRRPKENVTRARKLTSDFFQAHPHKGDLESFAVDNIVIGDLIYDTYLRQRNVPTIDLVDPKFRKFFLKSITDFLFWLNYVSIDRVAAIITSHAVTNLAFPLRVGIEKEIPCFVGKLEAMYRLSRKRTHSACEFLDYPEYFDSLCQSEQEKIVREAKSVLQKRFTGLIPENSDITEISAQSYRKVSSEPVLSKTKKTKVLVALHAFSDAPHEGGNALFPDYWEWTEYLAKWSETSDYEWYFKNHPDLSRGDRPTVDALLKRFPHLTVLPDDVTHHQLIEEGVSVVLTVRGTIGFEYALLGVPVVNASRTNPHIRYPFNFHPQTIAELENLLSNLHQIPKPTESDKDLALQYFSVKNYYSKKRLLMEHIDPVRPPPGPYKARAHNKLVRERFVESFQRERHENHLKIITHFVKSGEYFLS